MAIGAAAGGWSADHISPRATLLMVTVPTVLSLFTILANNSKLKSLYKIHLELANERARNL